MREASDAAGAATGMAAASGLGAFTVGSPSNSSSTHGSRRISTCRCSGVEAVVVQHEVCVCVCVCVCAGTNEPTPHMCAGNNDPTPHICDGMIRVLQEGRGMMQRMSGGEKLEVAHLL